MISLEAAPIPVEATAAAVLIGSIVFTLGWIALVFR